MINTVTQIDGNALHVIDGQESQEADEPPIAQPVSASDHRKPTGRTSLPINQHTPSHIIDSKDATQLSVSQWDGDPGSAHLCHAADVAASLGVVSMEGISTAEASHRWSKYGYNKIEGAGQVSVGEILLRQVSNSLTIVLLIAMALSYGTLDFIEGAVITIVFILNIILGFVQDFRAEKTMHSLLSLAAPESQVIRNGKIEIVRAEALVPGDVVKLATGIIVPADLRLYESSNLEIDEALLTGESLPASKNSEVILPTSDAAVAIGDRSNMAYSATTVTRGRATGIVVATGMHTQIGGVAELLRGKARQTNSNPVSLLSQKVNRALKNILGLVGTPMQVKLSKFAILLFGLAIILAIIVFSVNKWDLRNEVVLYGICVAVAVVPESLIAVMTITIAVGVKAMAQGNVVIRKMAALEAIGGVTNICSDKTGTLTQGKMVAHKLWIPGFGTLLIKDVTNILNPYDGKMIFENKPLETSNSASQQKIQRLNPVLDAVALCNFASVFRSGDVIEGRSEKLAVTEPWTGIGDPSEIALQVLAMRFGRGKEDLLHDGTLHSVMEHQFDSSLKRMSIAYRNIKDGTTMVYAKGASEAILPILSNVEDRANIESMLERLTGEGLRVLCIATKTISVLEEHSITDRAFMESGLRLQGLVGLYDPPRVETLDAVNRCHAAGIQVHMLTGDHLSTATIVAKQVGILSGEARGVIMSAHDFDELSDVEMDAMPCLPVVLARCNPKTKVRVVDALDRRGAFCVMTGDGVNDAPALKRAHVGIAMGINGTDVAKNAADMVLTDDNFASIVKAVEEGRRMFDNIQKFLMHLLISNIAQVILLLIALAFKDGDGNSVFPLSPLEILWVNMVTSSFLALGLGMEEAQANIMVRPPHDLRKGVFTWELITDKMIYGTFAGVLCLVSFIIVVYSAGGAELGTNCNAAWDAAGSCDTVFRGRSTVFAVLSLLLLVTALEVKHFTHSLFNLDSTKFHGRLAVFRAITHNRFLWWAVVAGFGITFPVIYLPFVNQVVFKHGTISWEWAVVAGCFVVYVTLVEVWKAVKRRWGLFAPFMGTVGV